MRGEESGRETVESIEQASERVGESVWRVCEE